MWTLPNILTSFKVYNAISDRIVIKFVLWRFSIIFKIISLFTTFTPQKPPKNHNRSVKEVGHKPIFFFCCLKYLWRFSTELLIKLFLQFFWNILKVLFAFYNFCTPKTIQKMVTDIWKRCGIRHIHFRCLKYMLTFLTKLLFKFFCHICEYFFGNVQFYGVSAKENTNKLSQAL